MRANQSACSRVHDLRGRGPGHELVRVLREDLAYRVTAISAFELALGAAYARHVGHFARVDGLEVWEPGAWRERFAPARYR